MLGLCRAKPWKELSVKIAGDTIFFGGVSLFDVSALTVAAMGFWGAIENIVLARLSMCALLEFRL